MSDILRRSSDRGGQLRPREGRSDVLSLSKPHGMRKTSEPLELVSRSLLRFAQGSTHRECRTRPSLAGMELDSMHAG